ncbi:hypothetical protein AFB00_22675 [Pseudonocardia sp. HH130630-07]|nr:hypothetical protein AFB00_22675 [Pseudonocardia sp. HH130630-07]
MGHAGDAGRRPAARGADWPLDLTEDRGRPGGSHLRTAVRVAGSVAGDHATPLGEDVVLSG